MSTHGGTKRGARNNYSYHSQAQGSRPQGRRAGPPVDCYCSAFPRGSGPCLPCHLRLLRLAEASRQRSRPG
jgi:hypothetical protein